MGAAGQGREGEEGEEKEKDLVVFFVFFSGSPRVTPDHRSLSRRFVYLSNVGNRSVFWQFIVFICFRAVNGEIRSGRLLESCRSRQ